MGNLVKRALLLKDYAVLKDPERPDVFYIVNRDNIAETNCLCNELYNEYGVKLDCTDFGLDEENCENDDFDWEGEFIIWWDGHNWQTIVVWDSLGQLPIVYSEVDEELALDILRGYEEIDKQIRSGASKVERYDKYEYYITRYPTFWLAEVEIVSL